MERFDGVKRDLAVANDDFGEDEVLAVGGVAVEDIDSRCTGPRISEDAGDI